MDLSNEIREKLPQAIGEELVGELQELARLRKEIVERDEKYARHHEEYLELAQKSRRQEDELAGHQVLSERESAVEERERNQKVFELELRLEMANERASSTQALMADAVEMMKNLTRNIQYRELITKDKPLIDANGFESGMTFETATKETVSELGR